MTPLAVVCTIFRQHRVTRSSISSATGSGMQDKGSLKVRASQSLTVATQCKGWIYFSLALILKSRDDKNLNKNDVLLKLN